jgi:hypothetical protein
VKSRNQPAPRVASIEGSKPIARAWVIDCPLHAQRQSAGKGALSDGKGRFQMLCGHRDTKILLATLKAKSAAAPYAEREDAFTRLLGTDYQTRYSTSTSPAR